MPTAEIITIGTEILLGEIVDTNTRYLARNLRDLGVDLYRTVTVGDNVDRIVDSIRESMVRTEIIITTGGLGPTVDDPTRDAVALAMGIETEFRPELWEQILKRFALYGRTPGENQKRQAYVPQGAIALENPVGTAPCFIVETERNALVSLPGVPREMETVLHNSVIPYLQKRYHLDEMIKVRLLRTAGIGEGNLDEKIGDLEELSNPTVGLAAHTGVVDIRLAAKTKTEDEANKMLDKVESEIRHRLGKSVFGTDQDQLESVTLEVLEKRGWKLVAIESGLGGRLSSQLQKTASSVLLESKDQNLELNELLPALQKLKSESGADAALGVSFFPSDEELMAELVLLTPDGEKTRTLRYGGHPKSALQWAPNIAIDILRRAAL